MGNLGQVYHKYLVGDGLAQCERQFHLRFLELPRVEDTLHAYDVGVGIRHLDTDSALAGYGGDDTYAEGSQAQGDVVLQILDLRYAHTVGRLYLVERNGRTYCGAYGLDLHAEVAQHLNDAVLVGYLFRLIDVVLVVVIFLQQAQCRVLVVGERLLRVDGGVELFVGGHHFARSLLVLCADGNVHPYFLARSCRGGSCDLYFFYRSWSLGYGSFYGWSGHDVQVDGTCRFRVLVFLSHFFFLAFCLIGIHHLFLRVLVHVVRMVGNDKLHLVRDESHGVQYLLYHVYGLGGKEGKERNGHKEQYGGKSRRTYKVFERLHDEESLLAAGIEDQTVAEGRQELGECYRAPYHHHHQCQKPLEQFYLVGMHNLKAHHDEEDGQQECWESQVGGHEPISHDGTERTAIVLELVFGIVPFSLAHVFQNALVGSSCVDERNHGDDDVSRHENENQTQKEVCNEVVENM